MSISLWKCQQKNLLAPRGLSLSTCVVWWWSDRRHEKAGQPARKHMKVTAVRRHTHKQRCFSARCGPVLVPLCGRRTLGGGGNKGLSGIAEQHDLGEFSAPAGGTLFNVGETHKNRRGMCLKSDFLFLVTAGLPSILPSTHAHTHTHTLTPPQLSYSRVEKESGIYSESQIIVTPRADSRLRRGGWHPHWFPQRSLRNRSRYGRFCWGDKIISSDVKRLTTVVLWKKLWRTASEKVNCQEEYYL